MAQRDFGGEWLPSNKDQFDTASQTAETAQAAETAQTAPAAPPATPASAHAATPRRSLFSGLMAAILIAGATGGAAGSVATATLLGRGAMAPQTASAAPPVVDHTPYIADPGLKALYKQVAPSVVSVQTAVSASQGAQGRQRTPGQPSIPGNPNNPGNPNRPNGSDLVPEGEGSGFVIDNEGHILTNFHVVDGASRVTVMLADGSRVQAQVVGTDPASDVALLQATIPAGKATAAVLGDSDAIEPGDPAVAIGNPFGLDHTLTAGIISATNREFGTAAGRPMRGLLQTDAAINPGNSGGPLLNAAGEVIGITTSIESPVRANVGIGFAIPINAAKRLLPQLTAGQKVQHAWLGISGLSLTADTAAELGLPASVSQGAVVAQVAPDSPAARAGLRGGTRSSATAAPQGGDVILAIDGRQVKGVQDVSSYLDTKKPGDTVTLSVWRDGARQDLRATLSDWPASLNS